MDFDPRKPSRVARELRGCIYDCFSRMDNKAKKKAYKEIEKLGTGFKHFQVRAMANGNKPLPRIHFVPKFLEATGEQLAFAQKFVELINPKFKVINKSIEEEYKGIMKVLENLVDTATKEWSKNGQD